VPEIVLDEETARRMNVLLGDDEAAKEELWAVMRRDTDALIRGFVAERAYSLWEQAGCPDGRDVEFWLAAERQMDEEADSYDAY
jgi:hypothetical protein